MLVTLNREGTYTFSDAESFFDLAQMPTGRTKKLYFSQKVGLLGLLNHRKSAPNLNQLFQLFIVAK